MARSEGPDTPQSSYTETYGGALKASFDKTWCDFKIVHQHLLCVSVKGKNASTFEIHFFLSEQTYKVSRDLIIVSPTVNVPLE